MSNIQVGVRVRPFLPKIDGEDQLCIQMTDTDTTVFDKLTNKPEKRFTFDFSFWSFDGFGTRNDGYTFPLNDDKGYKDQKYVFDKIGIHVLDQAWLGYHTCLFAYGQTGSGKSHSMIGYGANKGIVPLACEEIFNRIKQNTDPDKRYEVQAMMCEIYNEKVQDLMIPINKRPPEGLKIKESKTLGIFVDQITKHAVSSFDEITKVMATGESNRTKGATAMNNESSRAHTVIQIEFKQIEMFQGKTAQKLSVINLIDLAGSEKASQTQATGDRLKEGSMINLSLSTLGDCIKALVDLQNGKKNIIVPYRNSNLTRMLQNALGGSSKTYMICALRPGAKYFEESVSTLRYADRAKQIKTVAVVNESAQDKLIRELKAENERLKKELAERGERVTVVQDTKKDEEQQEQLRLMKEQMEANKRAMEEMEKSWEQKLIETKAREEQEELMRKQQQQARQEGTPHLVNLNEDMLLDRKVSYDILDGEILTCGRRNNQTAHKLQLGGTGIELNHCSFEKLPNGGILLKPLVEKAMKNIKVNGHTLNDLNGVLLKANDRICIGPSAIFLFINKLQEHEASMPDTPDNPITFDFASEEILNNQDKDREEKKAQQKNDMQLELKRQLEELQAQLEKERMSHQTKIKTLEEQLKLLNSSASEQNLAQRKELEQQLKIAKLQEAKHQAEKITRIMREKVRHKYLEAEYERIEKQLNHLLPQINEANQASNELKRKIIFTTKMVRTIDPFLKDGEISHSKTDVVIIVDNQEDKYFYEWKVDKFQNRLFMIRELLEEYFEDNELPQLDNNVDPFWDPPNPILIGQSFLQLQPLSLTVENSLDAAILSIDGHGGKQGVLSISYEPCNAEGNTDEDYIPEEFLVEDSKDLLGLQNLYFKVNIDKAVGLPEKLSYQPFVTYQFKFDEEKVYQTPLYPKQDTNVTWMFSMVHRIEQVTPEVLYELETGSISFFVYGHPPNKINQIQQDDGGKAFRARSDKKQGALKNLEAETNFMKEFGIQDPPLPTPTVIQLQNIESAASLESVRTPSKSPMSNRLARKATLISKGILKDTSVSQSFIDQPKQTEPKIKNITKNDVPAIQNEVPIVQNKSQCCDIF